MKKWFLLLSIAALAFLQLIWPGFLTLFNCKPDLLLILTAAVVFYFDFKTVIVFAVIAGLTKDAFLPQSFALNTILFSIWGCLIYLLSRQISVEVGYVRSAVVLIAALLTNIITGLQALNSGLIIPPGIFLRSIIVSSIYTAVLSPLVFRLVRKLAG